MPDPKKAPLTRAQIWAAQTDPAFLQRIAVSLAIAAAAVGAESATTPGHLARLALAREVLSDLDRWARVMSVNIALDPSIVAGGSLAAATDDQIDRRIASIWNSYC